MGQGVCLSPAAVYNLGLLLDRSFESGTSFSPFQFSNNLVGVRGSIEILLSFCLAALRMTPTLICYALGATAKRIVIMAVRGKSTQPFNA